MIDREPSGQVLVLLCGLPFSGKSTLSRALASRFGIIHVEVDRHMRGSDDPVDPESRDGWLQAYQAALDEIRTALDAGESVVFDAVGHRRKHRERMRRLATKHGARTILIELAVDETEARRRQLANRMNPTRVDVPDGGFQWIASEMERPTADESAIMYEPAEPLADWIERVMKPVLGDLNRESLG